jgi:hypothetical protein
MLSDKGYLKETMACQEMEAHLEEEPTSVDMKPEVAQEEEVPTEDATVMPVREPKKKRHKDQKLAVAQRGTSCHAKLAQKTKTDHKMSRHAAVARRRRDAFKKETTQGNFGSRRKELAAANCLQCLRKQPSDEKYSSVLNQRERERERERVLRAVFSMSWVASSEWK